MSFPLVERQPSGVDYSIPAADAAPSRHKPSRWRVVRAWTLRLLFTIVSIWLLLTVVVPFVLNAEAHTVLGSDMRPAFAPGTLVASRPTPVADIGVGDVISYDSIADPAVLLMHRVVEISTEDDGGRLFVTRADDTTLSDSVVSPSRIHGVVVYAVPWMGYAHVFVEDIAPSSLVIIVGVVVLAWGSFAVVADLARHHRRRVSVWIAALVLCPASAAGVAASPDAARAATIDSTPPGALQVSEDGREWSTGEDAVVLFDSDQALVPSGSVTDGVWVRNASSAPATVTLRVGWAAAAPAPDDADLAADIRAFVDRAPLANGVPWDGAVLSAGESRRVDITLVLDPASDNSSRRAEIAIDASIGLREYIPNVEIPDAAAGSPGRLATPAADPNTEDADGRSSGIDPGQAVTETSPSEPAYALPGTGGVIPYSVLLGGAGAITIGVGLWSLSSRRRRVG